MVPVLLLIKQIFWNRYTLYASIAVLIFSAGYFKGLSHVKSVQTSQSLNDINKCEVAQEKLEVAHDQRVIKILSKSITDIDTGRLLSSYPDETPVAK